jgi:hypothetical protein
MAVVNAHDMLQDVRLGSPETSASASVDLDEAQLSVPQLSGSPPSLVSLPDKKDRITPPSSPNINSLYVGQNRWDICRIYSF